MMKIPRLTLPLLALVCLWPVCSEAAPRKRVSASQLLEEARRAFYDYNPELASEKLERISSMRNNKDVDPGDVENLAAKVERMSSMMQRVEDIVVIDSIAVGRDDFYKYYRLSSSAGRLLSPSQVGGDIEAAESTVVYMPESGTTMLWGGDAGIMESRKLTDGTWEQPRALGENLNQGGVANYPFLMADGVTLYYASDGDDSLGGLDIYVSRRNGAEFPAPQNMGMPYNSPYDDLMLAIDEYTGAGWWATDRNRLDDMLTIYVFVPSDTRRNINIDSDELADRARISSIALTNPDGRDFTSLLSDIASVKTSCFDGDDSGDFMFALPDGRVITRWDGFRSSEARSRMEAYVDALAAYEADRKTLEHMRTRFGTGGEAGRQAILRMEKKLESARASLKSLSNQVIEAEMR